MSKCRKRTHWKHIKLPVAALNSRHRVALAHGPSTQCNSVNSIIMASGPWQQSEELGPNKVHITILASEWGSSKGEPSTINRELAIQLAKFPEVQITYFLPKCSQEDRKVALSHGIKILEATRLPGYEELEWLIFPPEHLRIDVIVGHGVKLGRQAHVIRNSRKCKWIQMIHTDPEELGMFKSYENPISKGEEKHDVEVELCEIANFVVAIGPKLAEAFRKYLRCCQKHQDVFDLTPGIFDEFVNVQQVLDDEKHCSVLVFGCGDTEDFQLKGFDIAARSVAALPDTHLVVVGAADGKHDEIATRMLEYGISKNCLKVRSYVKTGELKRLFCEMDLVLLPSRTEGFGLTGLEALSAGLPVIVSKNSGFGEALGNIPFGSSFVIDSEDPNAWIAAIKEIWNKDRQTRLVEAKCLRGNYGTKYNWSKQCKYLLEKMVKSVHDASCDVHMPSEALGRLHIKSSEDEKDSSFTHPAPSQKKAREEEEDVKRHSDIILKVVLKLVYGGAWIAGTALILTKYRDDPERMIQLFQQIVLPCGVLLKYMFEGSIICILQVIALDGLQTLWQNFKSGLLKKLLENALITEDLYKLANGNEIIMEVILEETRRAQLTITSASWPQSQELGLNKVQVTILALEWGSSRGKLSTINRELAIQLAKFPEVQITYFLPKCSEEDRKVALSHGIKILEATRLPGYEELEWLNFPPEHLRIDVIVGHGVKLGHQALVIRNSRKCKWIQMVHIDPEELGMFKSYENPILKGEETHNVEVELCKMANLVVAVGPKLAEAFRKYLRRCQKDQDVIDFTPGILDEYVRVQQVPEERKSIIVLVFGRGDAEDFALKGLDIAARSVAALHDTLLLLVGAPDGKHEEVASRLLECGVPKNRLRVRGYIKNRESLKQLFCEVDLVLMPSRTEGFGLAGLEALSAGLLVIVSKNSGFGEALSDVPFGSSFVIDSEDPNAWTAALKHIWNKDRQTRLLEAKALRDSYGRRYSWSKQCSDLLQRIFKARHEFQSLLDDEFNFLRSPAAARGDVLLIISNGLWFNCSVVCHLLGDIREFKKPRRLRRRKRRFKI
ncbi:uncharacterized protein [Montipora foliosa]|uniref:uncharacterized protein isoform X2 n=1 Tax=Montipora foliosa TaxID=591990 RepID=UPI0035F1F507